MAEKVRRQWRFFNFFLSLRADASADRRQSWMDGKLRRTRDGHEQPAVMIRCSKGRSGEHKGASGDKVSSIVFPPGVDGGTSGW